MLGAASVTFRNAADQPLYELAPIIKALARPGGQLVLSGRLQHQVDGVLAAYSDDYSFETVKIQDTWARLNGVKHDTP